MRELCFIFLLGLVGCSNRKVPSDIIQPEKMKPLIFDMIRADQFVDNLCFKGYRFKKQRTAH